VITGGAGFIGSNLVRGLNAVGRDDLLLVDDLTDGRKFLNLAECRFSDFMDPDLFRARITGRKTSLPPLEVIFHHGACTDTTEWNGRYMMDNNYRYSKDLLGHCLGTGTRFIYASSAAVYGSGAQFVENGANERPVNVYGYSKKLFDDVVRRILPTARSQVAGLRYFNVYGPGEAHKGKMASVALQLYNQIQHDGTGRLFRGSGGFTDGGQRRDFVHVSDAVKVNLWLLANSQVSGIFNVGTGVSRSFNDLASVLISVLGGGAIEYVDMPARIREGYQSYTQADLGALRGAGYTAQFMGLEEGVQAYIAELASAADRC
jgi:ADP-L-glycero-D-manno-heptose 6-epimerase